MWFDLNAADAGQARDFYNGLFGWAVAPAGDAGPYKAWITDGQQPWAASRRPPRQTARAACPKSWWRTWTRRPSVRYRWALP